MEEGRDHVKREAWDQAASSFSKVLDQLPRGFRGGSQEMRFCIEMTLHAAVFTRLIDMRPGDHRLWYARGRLFATRREWRKAIADYEQALQAMEAVTLQNSSQASDGPRTGNAAMRLELATLLLLAGDEAGYHRLCAHILEEPLQASSPVVANCISRTCTLRQDTVPDWEIPLQLASNAARKQPLAWYLFGLGIAQFRAGEHMTAIETLHQSLEVHSAWIGRGQNYAVLAMACQGLGRAGEASTWLAKAQDSLKNMDAAIGRNRFGYAGGDYLNDWLTLNVLLPEAERRMSENDGL
jgi:tetratricopeptide (TPR) repeat protein